MGRTGVVQCRNYPWVGRSPVVQCSNYPWVGKCVFTVILVHPKSSWLLSVAIYPQSLPYIKLMSYSGYFNDCIVKVIGLAQTYV